MQWIFAKTGSYAGSRKENKGPLSSVLYNSWGSQQWFGRRNIHLDLSANCLLTDHFPATLPARFALIEQSDRSQRLDGFQLVYPPGSENCLVSHSATLYVRNEEGIYKSQQRVSFLCYN